VVSDSMAMANVWMSTEASVAEDRSEFGTKSLEV
jgi:hypothetical protein